MLRLVFDPTVDLHALIKAYTILAMDHFDGNKTQTADALRITLKTLYNRLDTYGIDYTYKPWEKGQADPSIAVVIADSPIHGLQPGVMP